MNPCRLDNSDYIEKTAIKKIEIKNNMQKESELKLNVIIKTGLFKKIKNGVVRFFTNKVCQLWERCFKMVPI